MAPSCPVVPFRLAAFTPSSAASRPVAPSRPVAALLPALPSCSVVPPRSSTCSRSVAPPCPTTSSRPLISSLSVSPAANHIIRRWFHVVLLTVHGYPFSMHVVSPSDVHTFGKCSCCHHRDFVVTRRYPNPFAAFGISSWKRKCFPTVACTLQSGICSGSYAALATESFSHGRSLR